MSNINNKVILDLKATLSVSELPVTVSSFTDSTITLSDGSVTAYSINESDYSIYESEVMVRKDWSNVLNNIVGNRVQVREGFIYVDGKYIGDSFDWKVVRTSTIKANEVIVGEHKVIAIGSNVICSASIGDVKFDDIKPREWNGSRELDGEVVEHPVNKELCVKVDGDFGIHYYRFDNLTLNQAVRIDGSNIYTEDTAKAIVYNNGVTYDGKFVEIDRGNQIRVNLDQHEVITSKSFGNYSNTTILPVNSYVVARRDYVVVDREYTLEQMGLPQNCFVFDMKDDYLDIKEVQTQYGIVQIVEDDWENALSYYRTIEEQAINITKLVAYNLDVKVTFKNIDEYILWVGKVIYSGDVKDDRDFQNFLSTLDSHIITMEVLGEKMLDMVDLIEPDGTMETLPIKGKSFTFDTSKEADTFTFWDFVDSFSPKHTAKSKRRLKIKLSKLGLKLNDFTKTKHGFSQIA